MDNMDEIEPLLEFAGGPMMKLAVTVFVVGVLWRLVGIFRIPRKKDLSEPRSRATVSGGLKLIFTRTWPPPSFRGHMSIFAHVVGYTFHIGLFIVIFGQKSHIELIEKWTGLSWPALPEPVIYVVGIVTVLMLIAALWHRLRNAVLRLLSNFDDHFSWFVTIAPVVTGLLTTEGLFTNGYQTMAAIHLFSVALLLIWFPFGKLMHAFLLFISRFTTGALFARKGAAT